MDILKIDASSDDVQGSITIEFPEDCARPCPINQAVIVCKSDKRAGCLCETSISCKGQSGLGFKTISQRNLSASDDGLDSLLGMVARSVVNHKHVPTLLWGQYCFKAGKTSGEFVGPILRTDHNAQ